MRRIASAVWAGCLVGALGCASARTTSAKDGQKLLANDQRAIEKADADYRQAVLDHGQSSDQALKAKNNLDAAKNQLTADQLHVQQLQSIEAQH